MKNSERFSTAEERYGAFYKYCEKREAEKRCDCLCMRCQFEWLELEAEKEEPLPCPFCGSRCLAIDGSKIAPDRHGVRPYSYVKCEKCGYESIMTDDYDKSGIEDIIAAHNRYAKAAMAAKEARDE